LDKQEKVEDRYNLQERERLLAVAEAEVEKDERVEEDSLSIAERMMRRAQHKTFTLNFGDDKNSDDIPVEFRILYSAERREVLKLINNIQKLKESDTDIDKINELFDTIKTYVKKVTVTKGMNEYYDSEFCQDDDLLEVIREVMNRTVTALDTAKSFRKE